MYSVLTGWNETMVVFASALIYALLLCCPLSNSLFSDKKDRKRWKKSVYNPYSKSWEKFRIFCGHDKLLFPLLWAFLTDFEVQSSKFDPVNTKHVISYSCFCVVYFFFKLDDFIEDRISWLFWTSILIFVICVHWVKNLGHLWIEPTTLKSALVILSFSVKPCFYLH